jgi:antibiotic biosynthesis monooxygenase (ABM) superfamily enzyme
VLRFSDSQSLGNWTASPQRAAQMSRLQGIAVEEEPRLTTTGLETWFSLPRQAVRSPPRWKMTIVTFLYLVALSGGFSATATSGGFSGTATSGLARWKNP